MDMHIIVSPIVDEGRVLGIIARNLPRTNSNS